MELKVFKPFYRIILQNMFLESIMELKGLLGFWREQLTKLLLESIMELKVNVNTILIKSMGVFLNP